MDLLVEKLNNLVVQPVAAQPVEISVTTKTVTHSSARPRSDVEKIFDEYEAMSKPANVKVVSDNTMDVNEKLNPVAQGTSDMTVEKSKIILPAPGIRKNWVKDLRNKTLDIENKE